MNNDNNGKMGNPIAFIPEQMEPQQPPASFEDWLKNMLEKALGTGESEPFTFPDVPAEEMTDIGYMPYPDYVCKYVHENYPEVEHAWSAWYQATKSLFMWHRVMYSMLPDHMMRCKTKDENPTEFMVGHVLQETDRTIDELVRDSNTIIYDWQSVTVLQADQRIADRMERHTEQEHQDDPKRREEGRAAVRRLRLVAPMNHKRRLVNYRINILREKVPQEELDALDEEAKVLED